MKMNKIIWTIFLIFVFLAGIGAIFSLSNNNKAVENMENPIPSPATPSSTPTPTDDSCPDLLVKNGNVLLLYNTKKPIGNGDNPIPFANLDEYIQYLEKQREKGIQCPILFLQGENNAQGEYVYRIRPSPFDLQGGLPPMTEPVYPNDTTSQAINDYYSNVGLLAPAPMPQQIQQKDVVQVMDASRESNYNTNQYAGFDPQGLYVGRYTNIDKIHDSTVGGGGAPALSDNPMDPNWAGVEYTNQSVLSGKYADNNVTIPRLFQPRGEINPYVPNMYGPPKDII
jgi:hypothetical protein